MKVTRKIIAFMLTLSLILSQVNVQTLTVFAQETSDRNQQLAQSQSRKSDRPAQGLNQLLTQGKVLSEKRSQPVGLLGGTVTGGSINAAGSDGADADLLQDPEIQKIIDEHFSKPATDNLVQDELLEAQPAALQDSSRGLEKFAEGVNQGLQTGLLSSLKIPRPRVNFMKS